MLEAFEKIVTLIRKLDFSFQKLSEIVH